MTSQFDALAAVSEQLKPDYLANDLPWEGSPFAWIRTRPSRTRGSIGELLIEGLLRGAGFKVTPSPGSDADRLINGIPTEIKSSTLWEGGFYKFQQIRDQAYDIAVCLGLSPFYAHLWAIPKKILMAAWGKEEGIISQHGGAGGTDTAWLTIYPESIPNWLHPFGGSLQAGIDALNAHVRK
jgi:hypothetical protein